MQVREEQSQAIGDDRVIPRAGRGVRAPGTLGMAIATVVTLTLLYGALALAAQWL